jgi:DNA-binding NtrC family response regulator
MARGILLVDDDEPTLGLMAAILADQGYTVFKATGMYDAMDIWSDPANPIDVLITDVRLQHEENGFVLAGKFLDKRPDVPVIFVSGDPDCFSSPDIARFGDSPFISKPFNAKEMVAAVKKVLA